MKSRLQIGDLEVEVLRKGIKNVHLSVLPPTGRVRISAPEHIKPDTLRVYVVSRLGWIRKEQEKLRGQARETPRDYIERAPWVVTLPGLTILISVLSVNLMGDGLRDALDPKLRRVS